MILIRSIVLADDDSDDHVIFRQVIHSVDPSITLEFVRDGRQLMQLLQSYKPDLLFLDLDMPYKNGLQCLLEMQAMKGLEDLPRIVFSSTSRHSNIQTAYEMGAHLYLIKADSFSEHVTKVKTIFSLPWEEPQKIQQSYFINGRYTAFI